EQMDHHDRPLAFEQVTERLLAVKLRLADEVQYVVLNLKRDADQPERLVEAIEHGRIGLARRDGAHPARRDAGIPTRLLRAHAAVIGVSTRYRVTPNPAELDRLPLNGLAAHVQNFVNEPQGTRETQALEVRQRHI